MHLVALVRHEEGTIGARHLLVVVLVAQLLREHFAHHAPCALQLARLRPLAFSSQLLVHLPGARRVSESAGAV